MGKEASCKAREKMKLVDEVKELKNLIEELRTDIVEKETCPDHIHKKNFELTTSLSKAKG